MSPNDSPIAEPGLSPIRARGSMPAVSVVAPCRDEAATLPLFHARLAAVMSHLGLPWEAVYVNDGSADATLATLLALRAADPRIAVLNLSRNFGKEIALTAGLDAARGTEAVVVIDADLQDPPELIPALVEKWRDGADVVCARRRERRGDTWLKRKTAQGFYRLMARLGDEARLPMDTGDFRLMSRRATDAVLRLRERHRFMKGLFAWIGYSTATVPYDRDPRAAGRTTWSYWRLWNLALEGITSFTIIPLRVASYLGAAAAAASLLYGGWLVLRTLLLGSDVPGYPSLMVVVLFMGGLQMITLGVIGEYLGRIFNETKQRPLYLVERFLPAGGSPPRMAGDREVGEAAGSAAGEPARFEAAKFP